MNKTVVLLLVGYTFLLSVGQILFKLSAQEITGRSGFGIVSTLALSPTFISAVLLYGALTFGWVWMLSAVPLSRAYPFVALSFVFTPVLSFLIFREPVNAGYLVGLMLILSGLGVLLWKSS